MDYSFAISLISLLIAIIVAVIAYLQYYINRHKLRLDLYNRRYEIYSKTVDYIYFIYDYKLYGDKDELYAKRKEFTKIISEAKFLFKPIHNISSLLEEIHSTSFQITGFTDIGKELANSPEMFLTAYYKSQDNQTWMLNSISALEQALLEYLEFHNTK